jgi:uncharacterized SAM-binding protein YcdF (DUF218 family)
MTMTGLCLLIATAVCCAAFNRRLATRTLLGISAVLFLAVGCGVLPAWLLRHLQSEFEAKPTIRWQTRNAIVLLGGGLDKGLAVEPGMFVYSRIVEAARLYTQCRKADADCKILISGGATEAGAASEADVYAAVMSHLGIMPADLILENGSKNTFQNAQFSSAKLADWKVDRVVLVSSGFHLQRSKLYFQHFGVAASPVRSDYLRARLTILPLAYNFAVMDFAIHEYVGIARYYIYNALGWNPPPISPATEANSGKAA